MSALAAEAPDFALYQEAMTAQLAPHGLENAKLAHEDNLIEYGNWKMVMENSRECYHCATGHSELMITFLDIYDFADPEQNAQIRGYWDKWEAAGFVASVAEGPHYRAARLPFTGTAQSITMDGRPAVARPLGQSPADAYGSLRWVHYPSTFNHCLNDYTVLVRMLPIGPEETLVTTKWLVDADAVEGVDYTIENLTSVWKVTNDQDKALVERNQAGVRSSGYRPGPYSPALEAGVVKFVDWYCEETGVQGPGRRTRKGCAISAIFPPSERPTRIGFLLVPGFPLLPYASAIEPLRAANVITDRALYSWHHLTPFGLPVQASNGISLAPDLDWPMAASLDLLIVCAGASVTGISRCRHGKAARHCSPGRVCVWAAYRQAPICWRAPGC